MSDRIEFVDLMLLPSGRYFCAGWCGDTVTSRGDLCGGCLWWEEFFYYEHRLGHPGPHLPFGTGTQPWPQCCGHGQREQALMSRVIDG